MFQHTFSGSSLRRTRTAVTAGALALAALGPVVALATPAAAASFQNATPLTVADGEAVPCAASPCVPGKASSYPSSITVSGQTGTVSGLSLTLTGVTHAYTGDLGVLLVGPGGQKFIVASDSGNNGGSSNATVTFSDAASGVPGESAGWGNGTQTYKPFNYNDDEDVWPSPAPAGPYANADSGNAASGTGQLTETTFASVFGGSSPNGVWSLYVVDDLFGDTGSISGGWSLDLTTSATSAPTTTSVTSSVNPSTTGSPVTFTADVTSGSGQVNAGTVTFLDGATPLGSPVAVNSSGVATLTTSSLNERAHTISADYNGTASFGASAGSVTEVVDNPTTHSGSVFCNTGSLVINDGSNAGSVGATPYPSHVTVSGLSGSVSTVKVSLKGVHEQYADDLDIELVGPGGQRIMLASDAGGDVPISGTDATFADSAAGAFGTSGGWGPTSKPVDQNTETDVMPAPAPAGWSSPAPTGAATLTSVFSGTAPSGVWSLYVAQDELEGGVTGSIGGWCVDVGLAPTAAADSYVAGEDTALTVAAPGVLSNDSGTPAPTVMPATSATTQGGTVSVAADGGFTYTPPAGYTGPDSFTYTATNGATAVGTVSINVTHTPVVTGATISRQQGTAASAATVGTVSDVETAASALAVTEGTSPGITLTGPVNTNGTVTDTVGATCTAALGTHSVGLHATDSDGFTGDGAFTVNVTGNTAPTLSYGSLAVNAGSTATLSPLTGLSDNGPGTTVGVLSVTGGTFTGTLSVDGAASATPGQLHVASAGPAGDYTVTVRATDNCGVTTDAPVTLTVNGAPVVSAGSDDTITLPAAETLAGVVSDDDRAPGGPVVTTWSKLTGPGTVSFDDSHALGALASFSAPGVYVLRLSADDGQLSATDDVQITVQSVPVITVPSAITVGEASPGAGADVAYSVTATGFPAPVVTCKDGSNPVSSGDHFGSGAHSISCTAVNAAGTDAGSFTITVNATPVITVPSDITVTETTPGAGVSVPFTVTATGVPAPGVTCTEGAAPVTGPHTFAAGAHSISCTATNASGHDTKSFVITVQSVPVISVPSAIVVGEPTAGAGADVAFSVTATGYPTPAVTCLDGGTSVQSGDHFAGGLHTLHCTATSSGGSATGSFTITVEVTPVLTAPADITVTEATPGAGVSVPFAVTATGLPTPTVDCEEGTTIVGSGHTFAAGVHTIDCQAASAAGIGTATFHITVQSLPTLSVPADFSVVESPVGSGTAPVSFALGTTGFPAPTATCTTAGAPVASPATLTVGVHQIACTASNVVGLVTKSFTVTVTVGNRAPVASAGGPYSVVEGQSLQLDASGSTDSDHDALTYSWDLNGDGTFGDATGASPLLAWPALVALGINDGPSTFAVKVRVSDGKAAPVTSPPVGLSVVDAAPVVTVSAVSAPALLTATLTIAASDPAAVDQAAGFTYQVGWGDGTSGPAGHGGSTLSLSHTYAAAGAYTATVTAADKDGKLSAPVSTTLVVTALKPDICGSGKTLFVGGTPGDDVIRISAGATVGSLTVVVDGVSQQIARGFTRVVVSAGAGNDTVTFSGAPGIRRILYGGAGDDTLSAGDGPAVLVGGDGRDVLIGGPRRDVLIGGAGVDRESGGGGDDILIDGATAFDFFNAPSEKALCGVQAEWTRTDATSAVRVGHLLGVRHGSLTSARFILTGRHRNIGSGGDRDILYGGSGVNWFLANVHGKGVHDVVHRLPHDRVTDL